MTQLQVPRALLLCDTKGGPILVFAEDSVIGRSIASVGHFGEAKINEVLLLLSNWGLRPRCFIDIGANIGTHTLYALGSCGFDRAIAIEADPDNFLLLKANLALRGHGDRARLIQCALSDAVGEAELELCHSNFGDHRVRVAGIAQVSDFGEAARKTRIVHTETADHVLKSEALRWRDVLVWMDTQGHEGQILDGGRESLTANAFAVVTEFWPYGLHRAGGKHSYFEFLADVDAIYDINRPDWAAHGRVQVAELMDLYDRMLQATRADHYPHTDLLCLRAPVDA